MRVESVEAVPYALPFREPYLTARGRLDRRELLLVRVRADGLVGYGEAAALTLRGGEPLARIAAEVERAAPLPAGSGTLPPLSPPARAALEIALLDLRGKAAGVPAWRLLGAPQARPIECNATLVAGPPAEVAAHARAWADRGFRTFKLKAGVERDVEQGGATRAALPAEAKLRVDANGAWSLAEAVERLGAMGPLELAEQPVATLAELAALSERVDVPLCADESVASADDARAAAGACRYTAVKLAKVGGPSAALEIARALPAYMSSALEGPVGLAAAAHVALAMPDAGVAHGLATELLFAASIGSGATLAGAALRVRDAPGLGVEVDEDALARFRI